MIREWCKFGLKESARSIAAVLVLVALDLSVLFCITELASVHGDRRGRCEEQVSGCHPSGNRRDDITMRRYG
jgi:hypothetical protein